MKVLITGVTGFIGSHAAKLFVEAGHSVRGLSRRGAKGERELQAVEYVEGVDIGDASTITAQMFEGIDVVLHLIGIIQESPGGQTFQRIHVDGTKNVIAAAKAANFQGRIIYMSAIGSSASSASEYSRTKAAAEELVRESGIAYTIFRPSLVIGPDGEFVQQMGDLIKHGGLPIPVPFPVIPVPGSGENKFQPVWVDDLLNCVLIASTDPDSAGKTFEVGGGSQLTFNELLTAMAASMGVHKPLLHAPIAVLSIAASVMESVLPKPPVTRDQLKNLKVDNITSSHAISEKFGIHPLDFDQMLAKIG